MASRALQKRWSEEATSQPTEGQAPPGSILFLGARWCSCYKKKTKKKKKKTAPGIKKNALPIEQSTPGFANSRVRAPPYVHPRGLGSRRSSLRGLNEEFYKKIK